MPAKFIKNLPFLILFPLHNKLMLLKGDGSLRLKAHLGPETLGNDRPGQPIHREAEVVQLAQMNVGADGARLETSQKLLRLGFDDDLVTDQIKSGLLRGAAPTILSRAAFGLDDGVERMLPSSSRN